MAYLFPSPNTANGCLGIQYGEFYANMAQYYANATYWLLIFEKK